MSEYLGKHIDVPKISDEELRARGVAFLDQYHPGRSIPVPIEEIVEFDFGIDIIPMPGFGVNYEVDAFISTDLTEIRIDQGVYEAKSKNRYRYSLAHELSHRVLHEAVFAALSFSTVAEWRDCREAIAPREYARLEYQANGLAGLILVPPEVLRERFQWYCGKLKTEGIDLYNDAPPEVWDSLERSLGVDFGVSQRLIAVRGPKDDLWEA